VTSLLDIRLPGYRMPLAGAYAEMAMHARRMRMRLLCLIVLIEFLRIT